MQQMVAPIHHVLQQSSLMSEAKLPFYQGAIFSSSRTPGSKGYEIYSERETLNCQLPTREQAYLGTRLSSWRSHRATLSNAREPDWWMAAKGVGTYSSSVLMPRVTCKGIKKAMIYFSISKGFAPTVQLHFLWSIMHKQNMLTSIFAMSKYNILKKEKYKLWYFMQNSLVCNLLLERVLGKSPAVLWFSINEGVLVIASLPSQLPAQKKHWWVTTRALCTALLLFPFFSGVKSKRLRNTTVATTPNSE